MSADLFEWSDWGEAERRAVLKSDPDTTLFIIKAKQDSLGWALGGAFVPDKDERERVYLTIGKAKDAAVEYYERWVAKHFPEPPEKAEPVAWLVIEDHASWATTNEELTKGDNNIRSVQPLYATPQPEEAALREEARWCPDFCPITRLPFFMWIEDEHGSMVPTYGGPYDSYTIPEMDEEVKKPWHERELIRCRYDHDEGYWRDEGEIVSFRIIDDDVLMELEEKSEQLETLKAERDNLAQKLSCARDWIASNTTKPVHELMAYLEEEQDGRVGNTALPDQDGAGAGEEGKC